MNTWHTTTPSQIVMYTTEYCWIVIVQMLFGGFNHIEYKKVGLEGNEEATKFVIELNNGNRSVPTIIFPDGHDPS
ncbi:MAG: hypothetical protein U0Z26_13845 [Anaerolineales bacterium]